MNKNEVLKLLNGKTYEMLLSKTDTRLYYVYGIFDKNNILHYIGKGRGSRMWNSFSGDGLEPNKIIDKLTEFQATLIEAYLIHTIGIDTLENKVNSNLTVVGCKDNEIIGPFLNTYDAGEYLIEKNISKTKLSNVRSLSTSLLDAIKLNKKALKYNWKYEIDYLKEL